MSATLTKPAFVVAKKGDAWLQKMGIGVQRLRQAPMPPAPAPPRPTAASPGAAKPPLPATPATPPAPVAAVAPAAPVAPAAVRMPHLPKAPGQPEYEDALAVIDRAVAAARGAKRGSQAASLQADFDALPMPKPVAEVKDFVRELAAIQPKFTAADRLNDAAHYDLMAGNADRAIRKGKAYVAQSGKLPGHAEADAAVAAAQQKAALALAGKDYLAAANAEGEVEGAAKKISLSYDMLVLGEKNKPLFARAEKVLAPKKLPPELAELRTEYQQAAREHAEALKGTDSVAWKYTVEYRIKQAKEVLRVSQQAEVADWFAGTLAKPADPGQGSGHASGLTTMPDLAKLDEAARFAVMKEQYGGKAHEAEGWVTKLYSNALADGRKLDLTPAQILAAAGYSGTTYGRVNGLLRGSLDTKTLSAKQLDQLKIQVELLCQALDKLPEYDKGGFPLFRWEKPFGDYLKTRYQVDSPVFEIKEFWSTGAGAGSPVGGTVAEIVVWGKPKSRAKEISMLSIFGGTEGNRADGGQLKGQGAGEVLFPPGTKFKTRRFDAYDGTGKPMLLRDVRGSVESFTYRIEVTEE